MQTMRMIPSWEKLKLENYANAQALVCAQKAIVWIVNDAAILWLQQEQFLFINKSEVNVILEALNWKERNNNKE